MRTATFANEEATIVTMVDDQRPNRGMSVPVHMGNRDWREYVEQHGNEAAAIAATGAWVDPRTPLQVWEDDNRPALNAIDAKIAEALTAFVLDDASKLAQLKAEAKALRDALPAKPGA